MRAPPFVVLELPLQDLPIDFAATEEGDIILRAVKFPICECESLQEDRDPLGFKIAFFRNLRLFTEPVEVGKTTG